MISIWPSGKFDMAHELQSTAQLQVLYRDDDGHAFVEAYEQRISLARADIYVKTH